MIHYDGMICICNQHTIICNNPCLSAFSKPDIFNHILKIFQRNNGSKKSKYFSMKFCSTGNMKDSFSVFIFYRIINIACFSISHNLFIEIQIGYIFTFANIVISYAIFSRIQNRRKISFSVSVMLSQPVYNLLIIRSGNNICIRIKCHLIHVFTDFVCNRQRICIGNLSTVHSITFCC